MTHVKELQAGHSSQGTSEPITPAQFRRTARFLRKLISSLYWGYLISDYTTCLAIRLGGAPLLLIYLQAISIPIYVL